MVDPEEEICLAQPWSCLCLIDVFIFVVGGVVELYCFFFFLVELCYCRILFNGRSVSQFLGLCFLIEFGF